MVSFVDLAIKKIFLDNDNCTLEIDKMIKAKNIAPVSDSEKFYQIAIHVMKNKKKSYYGSICQLYKVREKNKITDTSKIKK